MGLDEQREISDVSSFEEQDAKPAHQMLRMQKNRLLSEMKVIDTGRSEEPMLIKMDFED